MSGPDPTSTARERVNAAIARQDVERGRPLTEYEKWANLQAALAESADTPCPLCGVRDDEPCAYVVDGGACRL